MNKLIKGLSDEKVFTKSWGSVQEEGSDKPVVDSKTNDSNVQAEIEEPVKSEGLFDIKLLNDLSDKMVRGSLKKIYMAGKRSGFSTNEVIGEMFADKLIFFDRVGDYSTTNILK